MAVLERFEAKKPLRSKILNLLTFGYKDRERIREADKLARSAIAKGFREAHGKAGYCIDALARSLNVENLGQLQGIAKQLDRIAEEVEHAEQGYAPHFSMAKITKPQLKEFYNFDMKILDCLQALDALLAKLVSAAEGGSGSEVLAKSNEIKRGLNDLEAKLQKRHDIVMKILGD